MELTIQLVYNKVMKQVTEIKDIKRIDNNKMKGPFQIEFSQRAEWDIGLSSDSQSYAEFYSDLHPVGFHVKECLGTITECTGFQTNFKDEAYSYNKDMAEMCVLSEAMELGLCYKLVDIDWCAQLHPDP